MTCPSREEQISSSPSQVHFNKRRKSVGSVENVLSKCRGAVDEDFYQQDVFILRTQPKKYRLFAWLLPKTIEYLRSDGGQKDCSEWIEMLALPQELTLQEEELLRNIPAAGVPKAIEESLTEEAEDMESQVSEI
eukprot:5577369-Amphidinium_carterae.1